MAKLVVVNRRQLWRRHLVAATIGLALGAAGAFYHATQLLAPVRQQVKDLLAEQAAAREGAGLYLTAEEFRCIAHVKTTDRQQDRLYEICKQLAQLHQELRKGKK